MPSPPRTRAGFTLIEVLIVVVVLAILAAIAIPRLGQTRERAHLAVITSDFKNFGISQEAHRQRSQSYAIDLADLGFRGSEGVAIVVTEATATGWSAVGTHAALRDTEGCAVYLGDAAVPTLPDGEAHTGGPGVVQCRR